MGEEDSSVPDVSLRESRQRSSGSRGEADDSTIGSGYEECHLLVSRIGIRGSWGDKNMEYGIERVNTSERGRKSFPFRKFGSSKSGKRVRSQIESSSRGSR